MQKFTACFAALMLPSSLVIAQTTDNRNFDANRLRVTPNQEDILNVFSGSVVQPGQWDAGLWINYANDPVTLNDRRANGSLDRFASLLKHRADAHFVGSIGLLNRLQLIVDFPVTVFQERNDDRLEVTNIDESVSSSGIGDLNLTAKLALLRADQHFIDLAFVPSVSISTALPRDAYLGERKLAVTPELAASRSFGPLTIASNVALRIREVVPDPQGQLDIEHETIVRVAGRFDLENVAQVPLSLDVSWEGFTQLKDFLESRNTGGSEMLFAAGYGIQSSGLLFKPYAGGGFGFQPGYSIPDYRVFAGLTLSERDEDRDGDGLMDSEDRCPEQPEDDDGFEDQNGCPDLDNDQDGVLDESDGAPLEPEDPDGFEDEDGIPDPDNDGDGFLDGDDACPMEPGIEAKSGCPENDWDKDGILNTADKCPQEPEDQDEFEDTDGCPDPDNDDDGVLDANDECPMDAGLSLNLGCPDGDRDKDGVLDSIDNCPDAPGSAAYAGCAQKQLVVVKGCKIDTTKKVYFDRGKATIQERSFALLDNLVALLTARENVRRLRIEGHTDSSGSASYNKTLSQLRADAVRTYLEDKSIAADRLVSAGFGEERPVAPNTTARGRETNRRVEFIIDDCTEVTEEVEAP